MRHRLKQIAEIVENRLDTIFDSLSQNSVPGIFGTHAEPLILDQVRDLTMRGGKRLRPAMVVHGAALFDEQADKRKDVIDTAAALELFHTYLLIHDDIMDEDEVRRGGPTVHSALAKKTADKQKGYALGILAGDFAQALSTIILSQIDGDPNVLLQVRKLFALMNFDVVHGQALDILSHSSVEQVALHKTASYTTIGPLVIGATLAGANDDEVARLAKTASLLGIAFQYRDDILGTFGSPGSTGKSIDGDLRAGKKTILIEEARKKGSQDTLATLDAVLGKRETSASAIATARNALKSSGALSKSQGFVNELVEAFIADIDQDRYLATGKRFLIDVAKFIGERQS